MGSGPSWTARMGRGGEEGRIRLGTGRRGEPVAVFGDALKRMSNQLTYLYTDGSRYWYDTRPTVNRLARDRAQNISPEVVNQDIVTRLKKVSRTRDFDGAHVAPLQTSDVIDEPQARVVVLAGAGRTFCAGLDLAGEGEAARLDAAAGSFATHGLAVDGLEHAPVEAGGGRPTPARSVTAISALTYMPQPSAWRLCSSASSAHRSEPTGPASTSGFSTTRHSCEATAGRT